MHYFKFQQVLLINYTQQTLEELINKLVNINNIVIDKSGYRQIMLSSMSFKDSRTANYNLPPTDVKTSRKNTYESVMGSPYKMNIDQQQGNMSRLRFRSPLREQQIEDYNRIKSQLKRQISMAKQNMLSTFNQSVAQQWVTMQQYLSLKDQFKYQTQRLINQLNKLHEAMYELQKRKNTQIDRLKQQHQQNNYLNMSQLRQGHNSQIQLLETQLRKTKQMLNDRTTEMETTIKRQQREMKHLANQTNRLNQQVKNIISQKNAQLQAQSKSYQQRMQMMKRQHQLVVRDIRSMYQKQLNKLNNIVEIKSNKIQIDQTNYQQLSQQCQKLQLQIDTQHIDIQSQKHSLKEQVKQRYQLLKQLMMQQNQSTIEQLQSNELLKEDILVREIQQLKTFIQIKNQDRDKLVELYDQRLKCCEEVSVEVEKENAQLKQKLYEQQQSNMQQLQIMKVKIAALHENDIKTLIETYQHKLTHLATQIQQHQSTIQRLSKNLYEQTNHRYELRKKYSIQLSQLNEKLIKLRSGMANMQSEFRQKLQNQKSMMLLTSRNFIKDMSTKHSQTKNIQIQLHKIQLLYQQNFKQLQTSNEIIDEKVKIAQEQLNRLTQNVMEQKKRHMQTETTYKAIVQNKNQHIQKLQQQLTNITHPQFDNSKQLQHIEQLKVQLLDKKAQNAQLKDHCELLEKKISLMKAEIDQYQIEQEITQQQAKKQFQKVTEQNMDQFLKFYEARIQTLEEEKNDLKQLISSKEEKITSLVQKYQELQKTMKQTLKKIKKRTQLQGKVMALGMDNNLVKNMAEVVKNNLQHNE